ncbi:MAG TPA: cyanophycin synthetase [Candidatus Krumholzibacteria bacterium]|nr:cyanophycin synthetase [Candidatus Krumholzibacteria bacterium]
MDLPSPAQAFTPEIRFLYDLQRGETRLGLETTRRLLQSLGSPERQVPVVHVAGTNGKGSTTAYAAAMLQSAGWRVGRFTSPHVLSVEERVCIDGVPIEASAFAARVREARPHIERSGASFFEAMTALAAWIFADAGVDAAVYEVGLGGRLDATNALPAQVSIVTSIGHDHEAILGRGLRAICSEKLGIARPGVPLYAALERRDLVLLAREHCARQGAPFHLLPPQLVQVHGLELGGGMQFSLAVPGGERLWTHFLGAHYGRNAALAVLAATELVERRGAGRIDVPRATASAFLPGRFQLLPQWKGSPLLILDVAHNPEALRSTLEVARAVLGSARPSVVLGMLRDKHLGGASEFLRGFARRVWVTAPAVARAWEPQEAAAELRASAPDLEVEIEANAVTALDRAREAGAPVLVLGSHYLAGEVLPHLAAERGVPARDLVAAPQSASTAPA